MANISQNVNIEMLEKLPDGTYKRKYPKTTKEQVGLGEVVNVKQASETEFNDHLEDGMAHGIGNKNTLLTTNKSTLVGAINELFTNVSDGKNLVGGAITDVDDSIVIPTDPTFQQLANLIRGIDSELKWAKGTGLSYADEPVVINLDFTPKVILLTKQFESNYTTFYWEQIGVKLFNSSWSMRITNITENSFTAGLKQAGSTVTIDWYAFGN